MNNKTRNFLAIFILIFFCGMVAFIYGYPYVSGFKGVSGTENLDTEFFEKFSSLFSGIIGVILGYYFGNQKSE